MKKTVVILLLIGLITNVNGQNSAEKIIAGNPGLHIGGYGQDFIPKNSSPWAPQRSVKIKVHGGTGIIKDFSL